MAKRRVEKIHHLIPMKNGLDPFALSFTLAILNATVILIFSILGRNNKGLGFVEVMEKIYFNYSLSLGGIISGTAEAAIWGLVLGFLGALLYNKMS